MNKISSTKSKPLFKSKPNVIQDEICKSWLRANIKLWKTVRTAGLDVLSWWELIVKLGIKKLLIERSKEINIRKNWNTQPLAN